MSTADSSTQINTPALYTEQPVSTLKDAPNDPLIGFFAIGMVINIVMITAFFIWAYRQWNKSDDSDE